MEKRISIANTTAMPIYVGSHMVPPGETRDFPESLVPPHLRPASVEEAPVVADDPLVALLDENIKTIQAKLPDLADADIARLLEIESDGQSRKTLVEALSRMLAERTLDASMTAVLHGAEEDVLAALPDISNAEIERMIELETDGDKREAVLTAAAAELLKRKG